MRATPTRTRPRALYLVLVVVPTATLVGLSLESLRREVRAVRRLTDINRELLAEQLGTELERVVTLYVEECLRTANPRDLGASLAACPIASNFFLFENGMLLNPSAVDSIRGFLDDLRFMPHLPANRIYALGYNQPEAAQFFYMFLPGERLNRMLAIRLNLSYVASYMFSNAQSHLGIVADLRIRRAVAGDCRGCFREVFPFWTIVAHNREGDVPGQGGLIIFSVINLTIMFALGLSVWQLLRVYLRQWRAAEIRTKFVSGFSHEIKTPLANIRLYAELLRNGGGLPPADARFSEVIIGQAEQLTRRVNKVLSAALIDQGRRRYDLREADLRQIVLLTIERYRNWMTYQGFMVEAEIGPATFVMCDAEAIAETLVSLLENAIKYSGGSRVVRIALRQETATAVVEVEDNGVGIAEAERERIFEEFYQARNTRAPGGFGLGLYLADHVMRAHGGSVEVESEPGRGTRFQLRFPISSHAHDPDC